MRHPIKVSNRGTEKPKVERMLEVPEKVVKGARKAEGRTSKGPGKIAEVMGGRRREAGRTKEGSWEDRRKDAGRSPESLGKIAGKFVGRSPDGRRESAGGS